MWKKHQILITIREIAGKDDSMRLYDWQAEALEKWEENKFRGIVNVVTGAGKTMLAIAAVKKLFSIFGSQDFKIKIIVPKTFLVRQWSYALKEILDIPKTDIGVFSGSHKDSTDHKFMIYVINSARYTFTRHMLNDYKSKQSVFIIADECHHYGTQENARIFDFMEIIPNFTQYYTLGLSATPYSKNYENILVPCLGNEIYRFTFSEALNADIISKFSIINIGLDFDASERAEYDELSDRITIALFQLKKHCPYLYIRNNKNFFVQMENIIKNHKNPDISQLAQMIMLLSYQRKEIVYSANARLKCVSSLIEIIDKNAKIIIFGERIESADTIYNQLKNIYTNEVGVYHSKLHKDTRKNILRQFEDFQIRILVSCKTLDEGLNISDTDVGIVSSSTSSKRQRIQRLGRILRKKNDGRQAYFYYIYVKETMEETEVFNELNDSMIKNINIIDLYYNEKTQKFTNPYYIELADMAIKKAKNKLWGDSKILELQRNIDIGIISCDWLMSKKECIIKIKESPSKREKNYYIAMLCLIKAHLSKISME